MRYYWPDAEISGAQTTMFENLVRTPPPPSLISQYLPLAHAALRDGRIGNGSPAELAMAHVAAVLDDYHEATWRDLPAPRAYRG
jgi:D-tagatose-1,6-bisphosphate aldolase subunit GatZ/KbaZ